MIRRYMLSKATHQWIPQHETDCTCDHCTGARSWTSTEEYLRWSAGGDMGPDDDTPEEVEETEARCRSCKWFRPESLASRHSVNPDEPAECNHPTGWRTANLPTFPFAHGCKHHEGR